MARNDAKSSSLLGFLTVVDHRQHGLFGGYLVLNGSGRPVEFHCTAPIKPNRAQEILYGPTLQSFLYGEQIGRTLLSKATSESSLVCTDCPPALSVREHVRRPVVLVLSADCSAQDTQSESRRIDAAHPGGGANSGGPHLVRFELGCNRLAVPAGAEDDRRLITERFAELAESFDLAEPFARIREAIGEAQKAVR